MRQLTLKSLTFIVVLVFASAAWTQDGSENGISSHETKNHIGEFANGPRVVERIHGFYE